MGKRGPSIDDLARLMDSQPQSAVVVDDESLAVDDILRPAAKPRIKSGRKGKRREREVVDLLNERFSDVLSKNPGWGTFSRSIGSGNRWGQRVQLSKQTMDKFSGDIIPPEGFRFVIESKGGYNDVELCQAFAGGVKQVDEFISQVSADSKRCGREPIVIWRKDRRPRLAILRQEFAPTADRFRFSMRYGDWNVYLLDDVLSQNDSFFFSKLDVGVAT